MLPPSFVALSHRMALSVRQAGKAEERFPVFWGGWLSAQMLANEVQNIITAS